MPLSRSEVQNLYTERIERYASFIRLFRSPQGTRALLEDSSLLRSGMRVLDAGCGFGMATFALLGALRRRHIDFPTIDAFDLTPAMLERFRRELDAQGIAGVELRQADVLALETLPPSWKNYNLILSASMLEYLPKAELPRALEALGARLGPGGHMLVVITRKTPESRILIERGWRSERYTKEELRRAFEQAGFPNPVFRRFPNRYFWLNRGSYAIQVSAKRA